jgi:peptidoglycan/LPS O-acetylase OafA/YrhL
MGALLAALVARGGIDGPAARWFTRACLLMGGMLCLGWQFLPQTAARAWLDTSFGDLAMACVFTWLVAGAARGFDGAAGTLLNWFPFVYLGWISYGVYVIHSFVPHLSARALHHLGIPYPEGEEAQFVLLCAMTIALASLSYWCLEKPINGLKRYFPYRPRGVAGHEREMHR